MQSHEIKIFGRCRCGCPTRFDDGKVIKGSVVACKQDGFIREEIFCSYKCFDKYSPSLKPPKPELVQPFHYKEECPHELLGKNILYAGRKEGLGAYGYLIGKDSESGKFIVKPYNNKRLIKAEWIVENTMLTEPVTKLICDNCQMVISIELDSDHCPHCSSQSFNIYPVCDINNSTIKADIEKPPLGVIPQRLFYETRIKDLFRASIEYIEAGKFDAVIPWIDEVKNIIEIQLKDKK